MVLGMCFILCPFVLSIISTLAIPQNIYCKNCPVAEVSCADCRVVFHSDPIPVNDLPPSVNPVIFYGAAYLIFWSQDTFLVQWSLYLRSTLRYRVRKDSCQASGMNISLVVETFTHSWMMGGDLVWKNLVWGMLFEMLTPHSFFFHNHIEFYYMS